MKLIGFIAIFFGFLALAEPHINGSSPHSIAGGYYDEVSWKTQLCSDTVVHIYPTRIMIRWTGAKTADTLKVYAIDYKGNVRMVPLYNPRTDVIDTQIVRNRPIQAYILWELKTGEKMFVSHPRTADTTGLFNSSATLEWR